VIVDIDGRTPASPSHALRILSSYQAGEKLKLNILRTKKRMSFEVTVPEDAWERFDGARFERGFSVAARGSDRSDAACREFRASASMVRAGDAAGAAVAG
jgi:hypothetical protein